MLRLLRLAGCGPPSAPPVSAIDGLAAAAEAESLHRGMRKDGEEEMEEEEEIATVRRS